MATINGAKALGLDASIGSLEVGKQADMLSFAMQGPELMPLFNVISQLIYAGSRYQVQNVWVSGEPLLKDRELLKVDLDDLRTQVDAMTQSIAPKLHAESAS